jgi:phosphoglycolate phosphatase
MKHTLLLFDIDGTLLNTGDAGGRAWVVAMKQLFGPQCSMENFSFAGKLDTAIYNEVAQQNNIENHQDQHEAFHTLYIEQLKVELARSDHEVTATPGMLDLLAQLRRQSSNGDGVMLGLLTGNYTQSVPLKLASAQIDHRWFPVTAFGDEATTRPELTALAMQRYSKQTGCPADPQRVIVIGDTPKDIDCAHAYGCVAFAVATGTYNSDQLREAGGDVVVEDLTDPSPLLELIR